MQSLPQGWCGLLLLCAPEESDCRPQGVEKGNAGFAPVQVATDFVGLLLAKLTVDMIGGKAPDFNALTIEHAVE